MGEYVKQVYKFYFIDGNVRILEGYSLLALLEYLLVEGKYTCDDIRKIEREE